MIMKNLDALHVLFRLPTIEEVHIFLDHLNRDIYSIHDISCKADDGYFDIVLRRK